jgi:hypothetical protein
VFGAAVLHQATGAAGAAALPAQLTASAADALCTIACTTALVGSALSSSGGEQQQDNDLAAALLPQCLQLPGCEDLLSKPINLAMCPPAGSVELYLAIPAGDNRVPPGDVHIGTAFVDGSHDDLAELVHHFFIPPIRLSQ